MRRHHTLLAIAALSLATTPAALRAQEPGHVTGVGGVFVKSDDPKALMAWYRDVLGVTIDTWGGALLAYDAPRHPRVLTLNAFKRTSTYMAPSTRDFMLDFAVDDMTAMLARLKARGVPVLRQDEADPSGRFAWILDPDGTKIELWEPRREPAPK